MHLDIHWVIGFSIKESITKVMWALKKRDKGAINHAPAITPSRTGIVFHPGHGMFNFGTIWPRHDSCMKSWITESCHNSDHDISHCSITHTCPESNLHSSHSITIMPKSVECNCNLFIDGYLLVVWITVESNPGWHKCKIKKYRGNSCNDCQEEDKYSPGSLGCLGMELYTFPCIDLQ